MNRFDSLTVFARVVKLGSFAAAARDLDISPAMVGNHVRALESWFGAPLLLRTTRQQTLTDLGHEVTKRSADVLDSMLALDNIASRKSRLNGVLHISAPLGIGRHYIAPALRKFAALHENLQVDLQLSDKLEDMVRGGYDLAVRSGPLLGNEASLIARLLVRQKLFLVASPGYLNRSGAPKTIDDLRFHKTVRYSRHGRPRSWYLNYGGETIKLDPPTAFMVDSVETLCDAVCDDVGIGWLPEWLVNRFLQDGRLQRVLPRVPPYIVETFLIWPASKTIPLKVRMAGDYLTTEIERTMRF